jgi:hypothetical protein
MEYPKQRHFGYESYENALVQLKNKIRDQNDAVLVPFNSLSSPLACSFFLSAACLMPSNFKCEASDFILFPFLKNKKIKKFLKKLYPTGIWQTRVLYSLSRTRK